VAASSASFHEPAESLSSEVKDRHRAIVSIMEELEAIDWYDQRVEGALRTYLFKEAPVLDIEHAVEAGKAESGGAGDGSLGIGSLRRQS
jgi:hypothetical protein